MTPLMMKAISLFTLCLILGSSPHLYAECSQDPIRVYACNWTEREIDYYIVQQYHDSSAWCYIHHSVLPPQAAMGKPENYRGTVVPNCDELYLQCGQYRIQWRYVGDTDWKDREVKICHKMPQPIELDFEE